MCTWKEKFMFSLLLVKWQSHIIMFHMGSLDRWFGDCFGSFIGKQHVQLFVLFCFVFNVHMMLKVDLLLVIVLWTISYSAILVVDFFVF